MSSQAPGARPGDRSTNMQSSTARVVDAFVEEYGDYGTNLSEAALDQSELELLSAMGVTPLHSRSTRLPGDPFLRGEPSFSATKVAENAFDDYKDDFSDSWEAGLEAIEAFDWDQDPSGNQDAETRASEEVSESTPVVEVSQQDSTPPESVPRATAPLEMLTPINDDAGEALTSNTDTKLYSSFAPKTPRSLEGDKDGVVAPVPPPIAPSTPCHDAPEQPTLSSPWIESPPSNHITLSEMATITAAELPQELMNEGAASSLTEQSSILCTRSDDATKPTDEIVDGDTIMEDIQSSEEISESVTMPSPPAGQVVPPVLTSEPSPTPNDVLVEKVNDTCQERQDAPGDSRHDQEPNLVISHPSEINLRDLQRALEDDNNIVENSRNSPKWTAVNGEVSEPLLSEATHVAEAASAAIASPETHADIDCGENTAADAPMRKNSLEFVHTLEQSESQERKGDVKAPPEVLIDDANSDTTTPSATPIPVSTASGSVSTEPDAIVHNGGFSADHQSPPTQSAEDTQLPVSLPVDTPLPSHTVGDLQTIVDENAQSDTPKEVGRDEAPQSEQSEVAEPGSAITANHSTVLKIASGIWIEALPFSQEIDIEDSISKKHDPASVSTTAHEPSASEANDPPAPDESHMGGAKDMASTPAEEGTSPPLLLAGLEEAAAGLQITTPAKSRPAPAHTTPSDASPHSSPWPGTLLEMHLGLPPPPYGTMPVKADDTGPQHGSEATTDDHAEASNKADDLSPKQDTPHEPMTPEPESAKGDVMNKPSDERASTPAADEPSDVEPEPSPAPPKAGKKYQARLSARKVKTAKDSAAAFVSDGRSDSGNETLTKKKQRGRGKGKGKGKAPAKLSDLQASSDASPSEDPPKLAKSKQQASKTNGNESQTDEGKQPTNEDDEKDHLQDSAVSAAGTETGSNTLISKKQNGGKHTSGNKKGSPARSAPPNRAARPHSELRYGKRETRGEVKMRLDIVEQAKREEELANRNLTQASVPPAEYDEEEVIDLVDGDYVGDDNIDQSSPKGKETAKATPAKSGPAKPAKATKPSGPGATKATPRATRSSAVKTSTASASNTAGAADAKTKDASKTRTGRKRKSSDAFQKEDTPQSEGSQTKRQTRQTSAVQRRIVEEDNVGKRTRSATKK